MVAIVIIPKIFISDVSLLRTTLSLSLRPNPVSEIQLKVFYEPKIGLQKVCYISNIQYSRRRYTFMLYYYLFYLLPIPTYFR